MNLEIKAISDNDKIKELKIYNWKEPVFFPYIEKSLETLCLLEYGYFEKPDVFCLKEYIIDNMEVLEGKVYIKPFWNRYLCYTGGVKKSDFVIIQLLLYELAEMFNNGILTFKIELDGKELNPYWNPTRKRKGKDTKDMIRGNKKIMNYNRKKIHYLDKCHSRANEYSVMPGWIKPCCVCNPTNRLIAH